MSEDEDATDGFVTADEAHTGRNSEVALSPKKSGGGSPIKAVKSDEKGVDAKGSPVSEEKPVNGSGGLKGMMGRLGLGRGSI